jgi:hypothetical protein
VDCCWEPWVDGAHGLRRLCRRLARSVAERLEKCICFLSLRALRSARACGSKEWGCSSRYPGFRGPPTADIRRSPCSLHPRLSYAVPTALCRTTQIIPSLPLRVLTAVTQGCAISATTTTVVDGLAPRWAVLCRAYGTLYWLQMRALWQSVVTTRVIYVGGRWIRRGCPGRIAEIEELGHVYLRCISFCERRQSPASLNEL